MNPDQIDIELRDILHKCNCKEHEALFHGVTIGLLRNLTRRQLKLKLLTLLSSVVSPDVLATFIASEIRKSGITIKEEPNDVKIKMEKLEPDDSMAYTYDDDEVMIIDEVVGEVSVVGAGVSAGRNVTEVTIDDDDEVMSDSEKENLPEQATFVETWSTSEGLLTAEFIPIPSSMSKIQEARKIGINFTGSKMVKTHAEPIAKPVKGWAASRLAAKYAKSKWESLYEACGPGKIYSIECDDWEWSALNQGSPKNLFRLVSNHCTNLVEINFSSNVTMTSRFPRKLSLPNLRVLKVSSRMDEIFNYGAILKEVILAADGKLQRLEFICDNSLSLVPFLKALKSADAGPRCGLNGLKSLSIENFTQDPILILSLASFKILSNLSCLELQELILEVCVMDEVESHFNCFLKKFTQLRKMIFTGCFLTKYAIAPRSKLDFSAMKFLESLELGPKLVSNSIFDNITVRPTKGRKGRKLFHQIRVEDGLVCQGQPNPGQQNQVPSYFPVTVGLPALPCLRSLFLGRLYELDELHLRSLPALNTFRVCSPWQLATGLQTDIDRQTSFPNITIIELPNDLEDDGFVRSVMPLFPKVQNVHIIFPTVKVLRAFAFSMKSVKSLDFVLILTQFEFPSTMDTALLEKPCEAKVSKSESTQVKILKKYKYWREWVGFHGVEVPCTKADLSELEDEGKYAGLCALKNNFVRFQLEHLPRLLRLPAGNLHWDDDECEYSDTLIGFTKFPTNVVLEKASESLSINFYGFKGKSFKGLPEKRKTTRREKCSIAFDPHLMANVSIKKDETD